MAGVHVNPENGEVGACRARTKPCPYLGADEHLSDEIAARKFYEDVMEGRRAMPSRWLLSGKGSPIHPPNNYESHIEAAYYEAKEVLDAVSKEEIDALHFYSMGGYEAINGVLRGVTHDQWGSEINPLRADNAWEAIDLLDKAIAEHGLADQRVLYRSVSTRGLAVKEFVQSVVAGREHTDEGYVSTTQNPDYALWFATESMEREQYNEDTVVVEMVASGGLPLQRKEHPEHGHSQSVESEILLPRGKRFEVVGVEYRKKMYWGSVRDYKLPHSDWLDKPWQRKIRKAEFRIVPVIKMVEVPE